ncbi:MAG: serine/threonine-protein kinase [Nannocystaceae bacterium]
MGSDATAVGERARSASGLHPTAADPSLSPSLEPTLIAEQTCPEPRLAPGTKVGPYVVSLRVGAGAMGEVYAAHDPRLDRPVALKLLRRRARTNTRGNGAARLLREGQALARLSHPNVVPVYDMGTVRDRVYVAMELVEGATLRRWARAQVRPWREVLAVMLEAGEGLAAAHRAGMVHRDFKPDNVLVDSRGHARVMDFGLARGLRRAKPPSHRDPRDLELTLTRSGAVMGTPSYMSPEQHSGHRVDARSDQFSFCVALYELLYGVRPFLGPSVVALARQKWHEQVRDPRRGPLPCRGRDVPRWLHRAVVRGLHPDPDQRWPSMDVLLEALAPDRQPPQRWRWLLVAGLCLVLGGVGGGMVGDLLEATETSHCSSFERARLPAGLAEGLTPASACSDDPGHARPTAAPAPARPAGPLAREPLKSRD